VISVPLLANDTLQLGTDPSLLPANPPLPAMVFKSADPVQTPKQEHFEAGSLGQAYG